jgi:hypothetical protein
MADKDDGPTLGTWYTAVGNWWEASVREEIAAQLALMHVDMSDDLIDQLTWGVATELDYRWDIKPKGPVPPEFKPYVEPTP